MIILRISNFFNLNEQLILVPCAIIFKFIMKIIKEPGYLFLNRM